MPATRAQRCIASVAAALFAIVVTPPGAEALIPSPTAPAPLGGWLDHAVHSRDVVCSTTVTRPSTTPTGEVVEEHLSCTIEMTDEMSGGALTADVAIAFSPATAGAGTWRGTFALAGPDGTWNGQGNGAATRGADDRVPALYGTVDYWGSGYCAGLAYHQILASDDGSFDVGGWVSGPLEPPGYPPLADLGRPFIDVVLPFNRLP